MRALKPVAEADGAENVRTHIGYLAAAKVPACSRGVDFN